MIDYSCLIRNFLATLKSAENNEIGAFREIEVRGGPPNFTFAQLVMTFFFSADKSQVKWDNSQNSTQKM